MSPTKRCLKVGIFESKEHLIMLVKKPKTTKSSAKAWVVTVDMGYGHQRAAYPLHDIAYDGIIAINDYKGLPESERHTWRQSRQGYEWISRFQAHSFIGRAAFKLFDHIQEIPAFYPRRDLSRQTLQLLQTYYAIEKKGLGHHLFTKVLSKQPKLPLVCTFFLPAFAAEIYGYEGDIYLQVCDADISRTWVPRNPQKSRIKYFASNPRVVERLRLYGVRPENILATGFPLPKENIGTESMEILKEDIAARIAQLDPECAMRHKFGHIINYHIGKRLIPKKQKRPLTIAFAIGGAGAQSDIALQALESLRTKLVKKELRLILVAGSRQDTADMLEVAIKELKLSKELGKSLFILIEKTKFEYFKKFNEVLRHTDILWTKPSELSFYAALGLPIIMAPSVGSQEDFNRIWLKTIAAGISQDDPRYTDEWLFDWVKSGWLARAALNGFSGAPINGIFEIEKIVANPNYKPNHFADMSSLAV